MERLAETLREALKRRGHSLQSAADEMGVSKNSVRTWAEGWVKNKPDDESLKAIARYIDVPVEVVYGWVGILNLAQVESLIESGLTTRPYIDSQLALVS